MTAQKQWVWNEDKDGESLTDVRELIPVCVCLWSEHEKDIQNQREAYHDAVNKIIEEYHKHLNDVKELHNKLHQMLVPKLSTEELGWFNKEFNKLLTKTRDDKQ